MTQNYCLFYKNNRLNYGWIREERKNKLVVLPEQGKEFVCSGHQIEYTWRGEPFSDVKAAMQYLGQKIAWAENQIHQIDVNTIYELCEQGHPYIIEDLAKDFLDHPDDGWERVALLQALKANPRLFKQKKEQFFRRNEQEIAQLDLEKQKKEELIEKQHREKAWVDELFQDRLPIIESEQQKQWEDFLQRMHRFLLFLEKSQEKEYFTQLLQTTNLDTSLEMRLIHFLQIAGKPLSWGQMMIQRAGIKEEITQDESEHVVSLVEKNISGDIFNLPARDQTNLECYTVDAEATKDHDDALSWEATEDGITVRVHISDVASFIIPGTPLFERSLQRISSVYTLKKSFPMLPYELSENLFSLLAKTKRSVMTFEFQFDQDGKQITSSIYQSTIQVRENLTYNYVDQKIQENETYWSPLYKLCTMLLDRRIDNGALDLERSEIKLDISDPDQIKIDRINPNTPARNLIQELAILANHSAARFAKENNLPVIYRHQPPYTILSLPDEEKLTLKDIQIKPARMSLEPDSHAGLGVDCYLQITSPIRRFADLVCQREIFLRLSGQGEANSQETLLVWAKRAEETMAEYNVLERELTNHWKYKYLQQHEGEKFQIQFKRYLRNGKALIFFPLLQLFTESILEDMEKNTELEIIIESVNPHLRQINLTRY